MLKPKIMTASDRIECAFLDLMDEKPLTEITVTEIIRRAEVARVTYYRNFSSISDIIDSITDRMADSFLEDLVPLFRSMEPRQLRQFLFRFLHQFQKHYDRVCPDNTANREILMSRLHDKISRIERDHHMDSIREKYGTAARMAVIQCVADKWARDGFPETPEEIVDYLMPVITRI